MDIIRILFAFYVPPVAAFMKVGLGLHFWISILLTLCLWFPGQVHAVWLLVRK